ncbi:hypothetical protein [Bombella intestini]|nr:hypothetical protein [Bombella intestini]
MTLFRYLGCAFAIGTLALSSCSSSIGPHNMRRDRLDYEKEMSRQQNQEMLFNIVQLRYSLSPTLIEPTQIISAYTAETSSSANINGTPWIQGAGGSLGGSLGYSYSDSPTVTYQPVSGIQFSVNILRPISPQTLLPLISSGLPVDTLLQMTMQSIGPASNTTSTIAGTEGKEASIRFTYLLRALRKLQAGNALSIRSIAPTAATKTQPAQPERTFILLPHSSSPEIIELQGQVRQALQLPAGCEQAEVIYGRTVDHPGQVAMVTRSMLSIWEDVASTMEVPQKMVDKGVTAPSVVRGPNEPQPAIIIHCSPTRPSNEQAYTSVEYEGSWYWIAKDDLASKLAFSMLQFIHAIAETASVKGAMVTIPSR